MHLCNSCLKYNEIVIYHHQFIKTDDCNIIKNSVTVQFFLPTHSVTLLYSILYVVFYIHFTAHRIVYDCACDQIKSETFIRQLLSSSSDHLTKTTVTREHSRPVFSNRTLSLRPNRSSGIPERKTRIFMEPTISLRRTLPLALTYKKWEIRCQWKVSVGHRGQKIPQLSLIAWRSDYVVTHTGRKFTNAVIAIP